MRREGPVVVRGGGEMASAVARLLFLSGFDVVVLERAAPLAVRRRVCFAEAVFSGAASVERVAGRLVPASVAGLLRGLLGDGVLTRAGMKIGDIDPRGGAVDPARLSDKGRAVAAGTLEAVLIGRKGASASVLP